MFNLNIKYAQIYPAIVWEKFFIFKFSKFFKKTFFFFFVFMFLFFLYGFLGEIFSLAINRKLFGLSLIFLVLAIFFQLIDWFFNLKIKKPRIKQSDNLAEFLNFEIAKSVYKSIKFAISRNIPQINSDILFYFILADNQKLNFVFSRLLLDFNQVKKNLRDNLLKIPSLVSSERRKNFSSDFQKVILESIKTAQEKKKERAEIGDALIVLSKENSFFKKILVRAGLTTEDVENVVCWLEEWEERIKKNKKFWDYENLLKMGSLAKEWTAGYTITLDTYGIDLTEYIKKNLPEIISHQSELKSVERILSREEINNVLLVGNQGTGRKSIVYALTKRSFLGQSLPEVNYKRIVELDLTTILANIPNQEEVEGILDKIFQEVVSAGNIILVIDELHNYIGRVGKPGTIDISGIISNYLHLPQFQIIGITTYDGLHRYIEREPSILSLFEKVEVSGVSEKECLIILENSAFRLERKYKKFIPYLVLKEIISLTKRYLPADSLPEKALGILNETVIYVSQDTKDRVVTLKHLAKIVTEKTQIPVGEIESKEKEILINLENLIHQRIINQEEAVREVTTALQRARSQITIRKGPMGCFLFLGPTGVGKTETSKALAEIYFGSEEKMIRLDMSEFQTVGDISRLLGDQEKEGLLTSPVRENPFSLVLLDEIEKSHPHILNLFLQVLDEGHLTDGLGRRIDFKNSIIIATSNAGSELIWESIRENKELNIIKNNLLSYFFKKGIFKPEFINRFDGVVVFKPLTKENLLEISELMLQKLKKNLLEKGIEFLITPTLKEKIVELSYSPVFGAREMRRVIQEKVENVLAKALLSGQLSKGSSFEIDPENFIIKINSLQ